MDINEGLSVNIICFYFIITHAMCNYLSHIQLFIGIQGVFGTILIKGENGHLCSIKGYNS